jgi:prepilin-type N-terminal cleavage/methylation domain-containing protein
MNQRGITLIELIMVVAVLGITLPLLLMPFMQASKGIGQSAGLSALSAAARYCMENEIVTVLPSPSAWPKGLAGDYQAACTDPNNPSLTITLTGFFYDAALAARTDGTLDNLPPPGGEIHNLVLTVTAADPATGQSVTLQTLKTRAF